MASVMVGKSFNQEQLKWLSYIQEHLVQNLTIEMDDWEYAPIFEGVGGKGKAKKVFQVD
ncbi:type I restriction-modification enzyme R subunit C-terminal domain-containing protein [Microcoleus sp. herbarium7]